MLPAIAVGADAVASVSDVFGSVVAVTGDAHQTKVAKDVFRQEVRYERSAAIREDIRDAKQLMIDAIQDELMIGSIVCGICFGMLIEGSPPENTPRILWAYWLVATVWSSTFALLGLWWALAYQTAVLNMSTHLLLHQHRFSLPDDLVVGNFGGGTVAALASARVASWHRAPLELLLVLSRPFMPDNASPRATKEDRQGEAIVDKQRLRKGLQLWGDAHLLDVPFFLDGQWLLPKPKNGKAVKGTTTRFRVRGKTILYIAGRPSSRSDMQAWQYAAAWDVKEEPTLSKGHYVDAKQEYENGKSKHGTIGTFRRVGGFSIFVEVQQDVIVELPIYKCPLATREDPHEWVDVELCWPTDTDFQDVLVMVREGHAFCLEENWPILDFQEKAEALHPLHEHAALCMEHSMRLLGLSAALMSASRFHDWHVDAWWFEAVIITMAMFIAQGAITCLPLRLKHLRVGAPDSEDEEKEQSAPKDKLPAIKRGSSRHSMESMKSIASRARWSWAAGPRQKESSPVSRGSGGSQPSVAESLETAANDGIQVDAVRKGYDEHLGPLRSSSAFLTHWSPLLVQLLCFGSFVLVPALHWLDNPASSSTPTEEDMQVREFSWTMWEELTLPNYGLVSEVSMHTSSSVLFGLSGAMIWNLAEVPTLATHVPAPIHGLGVLQNNAYVLHDMHIYEVNISTTSSQGGMGYGNVTAPRAIAQLPADIGSVHSAAFTAWSTLAVVVASDVDLGSSSALWLCWRPSLVVPDSNSTLPVLATVQLPLDGLGRVTALHICEAPLCGEESVLWIATATGLIRAVGLNSGVVLETILAPSITMRVNASAGNLRGAASQSALVLQQDDASEVVSLTGNATHLLCLVISVDGGRAVLSTPYPV
mmetsp:Transcript_41310/g.74681  ORF Transcript_41310/g.74681 Transcript_41310/m.74681 type:complete len:877 (-) Transcript_41310:69-2699(-)